MRKNAKVLLYLLNFFFMGLWPSYGYAISYPADIEQILNRKKLIVGIFSKDNPPFIMHDKAGHLSGYDIELAKYLAEKLGVGIVFNQEAKTYDEMIDLVNQKKVDIAMSLITPTLERAQKVRFTRPYLYLHQALLYNRLTAAKDKITDPANQPEKLAGLKMGLLKSSTYVQYSKQNFPNADYVYYENMADVMNDVKQGKLFAAFSYQIALAHWLDEQVDAGLYTGISKLNDRVEPIAIAVSWEHPNLLAWFDLALRLIDLENKDAHLKNYYFAKYIL
ncbi:MAG: extracellular solute-binding protein family 3 [Gammaproteobacteria bacterium]|nr:extracellular solute-binding protein family 3 [Gammaproteobacteria bacterium]